MATIKHLFMIISAVIILIPSVNAQTFQGLDFPQQPTHNGDGTTDVPLMEERNGNNTLGLTYSQTMCGLNYVQASVMTTTRYSPPGTGLPVSLTISGIPACAVIQQAYLYWIASTSGNDAGYTINGSPGTGALIGTGPDKCWSLGATNHYRASVTGNVPGNGTYTVNVNSGANATDGITLLVIYTDPSAAYRGTLIIHDGCIVNTSGGVSAYNMTGINACGTGTNTSAFMIMGDNQNNISPPTHTIAAGATTGTFPNNFYNFDVVSPAVPSGLPSMNFSNTPGSGDCYSIIAAGLYFRTTTCGACTSGALTLNMSQTADNCSLCNGTASVSVTGGSGTYTYNWSPAPASGQGTPNISGLCAGTYTVTVSDGGCNTATNSIAVTSTGTTPNTTITPAGPFCQTAAAVNLTAATGGGTWSGTGITNAATGTFNPATAGPGTHTITYTIGGPCGGSSTTTITVNALTTPTFTQVAAICSGGSFTLPTNSNNGFTGSWSPAINNTATTTYTFTPNAGQCATTTTMTVTVNNPVTPTFTQVAPICSGGSFTLPTTSNNGFTGTWSPAINNTATTTYTFTPGAGQCATTTTMTVTVNPQTTPTFTQVAPICSGGSFTLPNTSNNGINGSWSPAINNTATTTYTFTPTAGQCATTTTMTVSVGAPATPTFTQVAPICSGGSFTLPTTSNNSFTGTWSPAINNTATTTYTFTPTAGQCATTTTMTVTVNNPVTPTFTQVPPICSGGSFTLPAASNEGFTGTWSPAINNTATTTYTFTPAAGQCATTTTMSVTVNPIPVTNPISNIAACPTDPVAASSFGSTPAGATFDWTNSNTAIGLGASGTGNTPAFTATNGTGSTIVGTVSVTPTLNGCVGNPVTYTITVSNLLDATISPAGPFCESSASVTLTAVDAGGTWSGTGITDAVNGIFDPASSGAGTFTITYTIPGSCGATDTEDLIVNPDLDATITPAGPFCTSDPALSLTAVDPGGTWSGTGITDAVNGIFDPSISGAGTFTITYDITSMCGDTQTTTITVSTQLDATINPAGPFCASNGNAFLAAADPGGTWSGNGIVNTSTGEFSPTAAGAGNHIITYTIPGSCGDTQTTTIQVIVDADATITPAGPFCITDPALNLTAAQTGGVWAGPGITSPANGTFNPATAGAGTHTITYNIAGVCGDNDQTTITVVSLIPSTINPAGPFCVDAASVNLTSVTPGGTWSGTGITNAATGTFNPATAGAGTHTITYTISGSCGTTSTTTITVNPLPVPVFAADVTSGCAPLTVTFSDNTVPAGVGCTWTNTDGFITNSCGSHTYTFNNPGSYGVTLTLTDAQGCTGTTTVNNMINVFANPVADFTWGPTDATIVNPVINFVNTSTGADLYDWDFGGLGSSTATHPSFSFPSDSPDSYLVCLTATTLNGCVDSTCQLIEIGDEFLLFVPNSFTPDGDGINDFFQAIVNGHDPETFEMLIFNRWGELIFETQHDATVWEGQHKGMNCQEDVYVWKIKVKREADGKLMEYIGHVSLLR